MQGLYKGKLSESWGRKITGLRDLLSYDSGIAGRERRLGGHGPDNVPLIARRGAMLGDTVSTLALRSSEQIRYAAMSRRPIFFRVHR
jgi:hypothetical protein